MPPKRPAQKPTALRNVYQFRSEDKVLFKTCKELKSGLTPLDVPGDGSTKTAINLHKKLQNYQRERFRGFNAEELRSLDSLAPYYEFEENLLLYTLDNPLHPVFQKERWSQPLLLHQALFPLDLGRNGFWDVQNDIVWAQLIPGLRIASQILEQAQSWPWWDTLLNGDLKGIELALIPESAQKNGLNRIFPREASIAGAPKEVARNRDRLKKMAKSIEFHLTSERVDPHTSLRRQWTMIGETESQTDGPTIVWIGIETLEPLLNPQITRAERMLCHFRVACTVIHEFSHAIWHHTIQKEVMEDDDPTTNPEPYTGDEIWAEGFSMEVQLFGGLTLSFNSPTSNGIAGLPVAGFFQGEMSESLCPSLLYVETNPILLLDPPSGWDTPVYYPVPLPYFYNLHNSDLWNHVRKRDVTALHLGPKVLGIRDLGFAKYGQVNMPRPDNEETEDDIMTDDSMPEDVQDTIASENGRRRQVKKLLEALENPQNIPLASPALVGAEPNVESDAGTLSLDKFNEIVTFLRLNRFKLAMHTMHFNMGVHVLFAHITRAGLSISYEEFRAFLNNLKKDKKDQRMLLEVTTMSSGPLPTRATVAVLQNGWTGIDSVTQKPIPPAVTRPPHTKPSQLNLDWFTKCTDLVMDEDGPYGYFYQPDLFDFDIEKFRRLANQASLEIGTRGNFEFVGPLFQDCIREFEAQNYKWALGPPGIIRKLKNGWPVLAAGNKRKKPTAVRGVKNNKKQNKRVKR
ncbi:uncharacterized protein LY89DRAFT_782153 [Mollisia scopiformis]|uniref:Uncharacterized protein n=1 Tax=Mollisia scopiformis TaxID=149040 RepID=A0A194X9V1_MOLSC|nr:uncharacterized protein LY89DRAFT_782153 [Mollisia scopiformis]KUJ16909.1 hypothetical protein LY89DRAFT_782153 [Mollisia scopiformis]